MIANPREQQQSSVLLVQDITRRVRGDESEQSIKCLRLKTGAFIESRSRTPSVPELLVQIAGTPAKALSTGYPARRRGRKTGHGLNRQTCLIGPRRFDSCWSTISYRNSEEGRGSLARQSDQLLDSETRILKLDGGDISGCKAERKAFL